MWFGARALAGMAPLSNRVSGPLRIFSGPQTTQRRALHLRVAQGFPPSASRGAAFLLFFTQMCMYYACTTCSYVCAVACVACPFVQSPSMVVSFVVRMTNLLLHGAKDTYLCESVQEGLGSSTYEKGRYAPNVEFPMHHFHTQLVADLMTASSASASPVAKA